jgi:hypothetical protein
MAEFALIAPLLFLLTFGIIDFGRVVYYYVTLSQAANEGARVAVRGLPPDYAMPSDVDVLNAVRLHSTALSLANPCPNGPITSTSPPLNQGWIYITEAPPSTSYTATPSPNAPGVGLAGSGQTGPTFSSPPCNPVVPASNNVPLQVSIYYNFQPVTPLLQQVAANHIVISAYAVYRTEY